MWIRSGWRIDVEKGARVGVSTGVQLWVLERRWRWSFQGLDGKSNVVEADMVIGADGPASTL
jgi:flavin-dependent dehydrogenase